MSKVSPMKNKRTKVNSDKENFFLLCEDVKKTRTKKIKTARRNKRAVNE